MTGWGSVSTGEPATQWADSRLFSNPFNLPLEGHALDGIEPQRQKEVDPPLQDRKGVAKSALDFPQRAFRRRRIGNSPVGSHRYGATGALARAWVRRENRTYFIRRVVTDG